MYLIDCEVTTGKYLPAKRAAILVLSELLEGMDNLMDFEPMLLPVYRFLKNIVNSSEFRDEKMHIHASNGLKCLSEKCLKLIESVLKSSSAQLKKDIKITGIDRKSSIKLLTETTDSVGNRRPRIIEMD